MAIEHNTIYMMFFVFFSLTRKINLVCAVVGIDIAPWHTFLLYSTGLTVQVVQTSCTWGCS